MRFRSAGVPPAFMRKAGVIMKRQKRPREKRKPFTTTASSSNESTQTIEREITGEVVEMVPGEMSDESIETNAAMVSEER